MRLARSCQHDCRLQRLGASELDPDLQRPLQTMPTCSSLELQLAARLTSERSQLVHLTLMREDAVGLRGLLIILPG